MADGFASAVNREIIRRAAEEGQAEAAENGVPDADQIPPGVIAAPTHARARQHRAGRARPSSRYFGPAVLALILQHMAVTLIALSVVRDRTSGVIEVFRVSPVSAWEVVAGKILGFAFLCAVIASASLALLIVGLGVPMLGSPAALAGVVALLIVASLGLGLLISIISDSERQAVQLSLLVLLAAVFFSGFVLPISRVQRSRPCRRVPRSRSPAASASSRTSCSGARSASHGRRRSSGRSGWPSSSRAGSSSGATCSGPSGP